MPAAKTAWRGEAHVIRLFDYKPAPGNLQERQLRGVSPGTIDFVQPHQHPVTLVAIE
jgi:hypothetical protein